MQIRNAYSVLVGIFEGKRPLSAFRLRWEVNSEIDLKERASTLDSSGT